MIQFLVCNHLIEFYFIFKLLQYTYYFPHQSYVIRLLVAYILYKCVITITRVSSRRLYFYIYYVEQCS